MSGISPPIATVTLGPPQTNGLQDTSASRSKIAIAVGVIGAAVLLSLIFLGELFLWRARRRLGESSKAELIRIADEDRLMQQPSLVVPPGHIVSGPVDAPVPGSNVASQLPQVYNAVERPGMVRLHQTAVPTPPGSGPLSPAASIRSTNSTVHAPSSFGIAGQDLRTDQMLPTEVASLYPVSTARHIHPPSSFGTAAHASKTDPMSAIPPLSDHPPSSAIQYPFYSTLDAGSFKLDKEKPSK